LERILVGRNTPETTEHFEESGGVKILILRAGAEVE
jgi:hypothetical protein